MWPPATSTTIPSGSFLPSLTMVFKSEPSGFDVRTRPTARSRKNRRPETVLAAGRAALALGFASGLEFFSFFLIVPLPSSIFLQLIHLRLRAAQQLKQA